MIEIIAIIAVSILMAKVASNSNLNGVLWGIGTLVLCILSLFIPVPFGRVLIAAIIAFAVMTVYLVKRGPVR